MSTNCVSFYQVLHGDSANCGRRAQACEVDRDVSDTLQCREETRSPLQESHGGWMCVVLAQPDVPLRACSFSLAVGSAAHADASRHNRSRRTGAALMSVSIFNFALALATAIPGIVISRQDQSCDDCQDLGGVLLLSIGGVTTVIGGVTAAVGIPL